MVYASQPGGSTCLLDKAKLQNCIWKAKLVIEFRHVLIAQFCFAVMAVSNSVMTCRCKHLFVIYVYHCLINWHKSSFWSMFRVGCAGCLEIYDVS